MCITNFTNRSTGLLAAKSAVNKVIFNCTLHKTNVNKYQNSNKYLNELNICCSSTPNHCYITIATQDRLHKHVKKLPYNAVEKPHQYIRIWHYLATEIIFYYCMYIHVWIVLLLWDSIWLLWDSIWLLWDSVWLVWDSTWLLWSLSIYTLTWSYWTWNIIQYSIK